MSSTINYSKSGSSLTLCREHFNEEVRRRDEKIATLLEDASERLSAAESDIEQLRGPIENQTEEVERYKLGLQGRVSELKTLEREQRFSTADKVVLFAIALIPVIGWAITVGIIVAGSIAIKDQRPTLEAKIRECEGLRSNLNTQEERLEGLQESLQEFSVKKKNIQDQIEQINNGTHLDCMKVRWRLEAAQARLDEAEVNNQRIVNNMS